MLLCGMSCHDTQLMALSLQNVVVKGRWLLACTSVGVVILNIAILDCFVSSQMSSSCQDQWQGSHYTLYCLHYSCYWSRIVALCTVKSAVKVLLASTKIS